MKYKIEVEFEEKEITACLDDNFDGCPYYRPDWRDCRAMPEYKDVPRPEEDWDSDDYNPMFAPRPEWCPLRKVE